MKILNKYSPEEYAAFWGSDSSYCKDATLLYNFGSEHNIRTSEFLSDFKAAIQTTIRTVKAIPDSFGPDDVKGLTQLLDYVATLKPQRNQIRRAS